MPTDIIAGGAASGGMRPTRIIVFAKAPVAGEAKTRLIPALGAEGAARLAADMLAATVSEAIDAGLAQPELCVTPDPGDRAWTGHLPEGVRLSSQGEGDLGQRLAAAARRAIGEGERVLLIGTDCPGLDRERLRAVADRLDGYDAVIHPARDGGYVLLGLRRFDPSLFNNIAWSTDSVARETILRIKSLGWMLHVGDTLDDIDTPDDLRCPVPRATYSS